MEFQSTLLQEERHFTGSIIDIGFSISIHAPTRGATSRFLYPLLACFISIHAPTRGATYEYLFRFYDVIFQSTLLQEERRK